MRPQNHVYRCSKQVASFRRRIGMVFTETTNFSLPSKNCKSELHFNDKDVFPQACISLF